MRLQSLIMTAGAIGQWSAPFLPTASAGTCPVASASYSEIRHNKRVPNPPRGGDTLNTNQPGDTRAPPQRPTVLIIDVDNTLYSESEAASATPNCPGVEEQIIRNTHAFGLRYYNLTKEECDELYRTYGSTVEGLRRTVLDDDSEQTREMLKRFYHEVFDDIDVSCLFSGRGYGGHDGESNTGYSHIDIESRKRHFLADFLKNVPCPIYFASNSSRGHVLKVLTALGLRDVQNEGILTPDVLEHDLGSGGDEPYPTKSSPAQFYKPILDKYPPEENCVVLLDDSKLNLDKASSVGIEGLRVDKEFPLEEALAVSLRHISSKFLRDGAMGGSLVYEFSDVKYLRSKNAVDALSINRDVWQRLAEELSTRIVPSLTDGVLRIADVGAGLLSMLELIMVGGSEKDGLFHMMQSSDASFVEKVKQVHYYAYESNINLIDGCKETLLRLGFSEVAEFCVGGKPQEVVFRGKLDSSPSISVTVHLRTNDFSEEKSKSFKTPNLVVGCCFADLFDPHELVQSLMSFTKLCSRGGGSTISESREGSNVLLYFPITFAGTTQFHPPHPFGVGEKTMTRSTPSDTCGFRLYADSLTRKLGHNLDPNRIISAIRDHGGRILARGKSNWSIDPSKHPYLWETMMYFFGTSGAPEMMTGRWNAQGWIARARKSRPSIVVSNTDLLLCLGAADGGRVSNSSEKVNLTGNAKKIVDEIQFVSPHRVRKTTKEWTTEAGVHLGPNQVEVKAVSSLISSGTELKIFKGMFEEAALDVNIKGMAGTSMAYPLSYGYSLVGIVTQCGAEVADATELLGRLVFTFSPHSSHALVDRDAIQIVPEGIGAEDAIFMPSVETALSLVHDAHVRVGEKVAVFGQGLIGLLITAILRLSTTLSGDTSGRFGTVTAFDTISDRLAASSDMGASQALLPAEASASGPFDVSIEVSGNARALQSAIDNTSSGGRIIVGSWYGNADVNLKLGIDFHRSHKTIKTSQVSEIPAELSSLWTKERRFGLTWELLRAIRPSRLITKRVSLDEAQEAYESLDNGKEIAVAFEYNQ